MPIGGGIGTRLNARGMRRNTGPTRSRTGSRSRRGRVNPPNGPEQTSHRRTTPQLCHGRLNGGEPPNLPTPMRRRPSRSSPVDLIDAHAPFGIRSAPRRHRHVSQGDVFEGENRSYQARGRYRRARRGRCSHRPIELVTDTFGSADGRRPHRSSQIAPASIILTGQDEPVNLIKSRTSSGPTASGPPQAGGHRPDRAPVWRVPSRHCRPRRPLRSFSGAGAPGLPRALIVSMSADSLDPRNHVGDRPLTAHHPGTILLPKFVTARLERQCVGAAPESALTPHRCQFGARSTTRQAVSVRINASRPVVRDQDRDRQVSRMLEQLFGGRRGRRFPSVLLASGRGCARARSIDKLRTLYRDMSGPILNAAPGHGRPWPR